MADETTPTPPAPRPPTDETQPKIVHRLAVRTLVAVVALGGLFYGLRAWREYSKDPGRVGFAKTTDAIAAIELLDNGQQAVIIQPNGEIVRSPDYAPGNTERDLCWQPDGSRLFYVSDREKGTPQVFRWKPIPGGESEPRTIGTRGKSYPSFAPGDTEDDLLITSGGVVLELDPVNQHTRQVLPPIANGVVQSTEEEGGGGTSQFSGAYGRLGESFGMARYLPGREYVAAIMRRDRGDVLIVQSLVLTNGKLRPPMPVAAGDRVEFTIAADGTVVYSVQNFQWPDQAPAEFVKNGRITTPFKHYVGMYHPGKDPVPPIAVSPDAESAFGSLAVSPDSSRVLIVLGRYQDSNFTPTGLVVCPLQPGGVQGLARLVPGEVFDPAWHPSGKKIAYVKRDGDKRSIYTANDDGSSETNLTGGKGDFSHPVFSPQKGP
jgi:hypothetical protein